MKTRTNAAITTRKPAPKRAAPAREIDRECPKCGKPGPHEDNGASTKSVDYTVLCVGCGHQWSPNDG